MQSALGDGCTELLRRWWRAIVVALLMVFIADCATLAQQTPADNGNANGTTAQTAPVKTVPETNQSVLLSPQDIEKDPWASAKPYIDFAPPQLETSVPELKGMVSAESQGELASILDHAGDKCTDLLNRMPNLISREAVTTVVPQAARAGFNLEQHIGIKQQTYEYLLLSHSTQGGSTELEEFRTLHGHPVETTMGGFAISQGFVSDWLRLYPGNRSEARFRYLGQQEIDKRKTFVVGFAQIPGSVKRPARFVAYGLSFDILFQGIVWVDASDYRIVRMREDLLAPRPDIHLQKFTTRIRFGEVHISEAEVSLWLPEEVDVDWDFNGRIINRKHVYSKYRLYTAKAKIIP
jgi:hypothetical protein